MTLCLMSVGLVSASETCKTTGPTTLCSYSFNSSPAQPFWTDTNTNTDLNTGTYQWRIDWTVYAADHTTVLGSGTINKTRGDGTPGDAAWYGVHSVNVNFSGSCGGWCRLSMTLTPLNAYGNTP
jgi:hypothetical protein